MLETGSDFLHIIFEMVRRVLRNDKQRFKLSNDDQERYFRSLS